MKDKGFTLIELLGSIVILVMIVLLAFPATLNLIGNSEEKIDEAKKSVIIGAAKDYVNDNVNNYKRDESFNDKNVKIQTNTLIEQGYITNKDIIENNNFSNSCVEVSINNVTKKYQFEYKNSCS